MRIELWQLVSDNNNSIIWKVIEINIDKFEKIVQNEEIVNYPYINYWLKYFLVQYKEFKNNGIINSYIIKEDQDFWPRAIFAVNNKDIAWIRKYKNKIDEYGSRDKRAIMYSSLALSKDERKHWMESIINNSPSFLDGVFAKYLKSR